MSNQDAGCRADTSAPDLAAVIGGIAVARKTPPRDQPFTSGGDAPGEVDIVLPRSQRDEPEEPRA